MTCSAHDRTVTLAMGAGGAQTARLIEEVFAANFDNPLLTADDAAVLEVARNRLAMSTDGFIVSPAIFAGGNIGKLSVCGTVNDIACMGARPLYLTCAFVIEEGFSLDDLSLIARSMAECAREAGVSLVAGDTKVAGRGQVDGVFITTTGIGEVLEGAAPKGSAAEPGDVVIVTGDIGRHGTTILLARDDFGIDADVTSDCAPLWSSVEAMYEETCDIHVIRDATRGGVGTVLYEICHQSNVGIALDQAAIPVDPAVAGVCRMLGLEPLYLACEGRLVVICPREVAPRVLTALRCAPHSGGATIIGEVTAERPGWVVMRTEVGTTTLLPQPQGELLPRIC